MIQLLEFIHNVGKLKQLKRAGWVRHGIDNVESVADHSFRLAIMSMLIGGAAKDNSNDLDINKMLKLALIHDLAEIGAGDITPYDGVTPERKIELETASLTNLVRDLDNSEEFLELWDEFVSNTTPESQLVNELDKLEMVFQAKEYGGTGIENLEEFYTFKPETFRNETVKKLYELLISDNRKDF
jgi:putative hydrolase of HD superfamily